MALCACCGVSEEHLGACARWPWCIRDDAPIASALIADIALSVRWGAISVAVTVPGPATSTQVVAAAVSALKLVQATDATVILPPGPAILKVMLVLRGRLAMR